MHSDIKLMLRGDFVKTTATCITFDLNHRKAVACIFPDARIGCQQPFLDELLIFFGGFNQIVFFLFSLRNNVVQFIAFDFEVIFTIGE